MGTSVLIKGSWYYTVLNVPGTINSAAPPPGGMPAPAAGTVVAEERRRDAVLAREIELALPAC